MTTLGASADALDGAEKPVRDRRRSGGRSRQRVFAYAFVVPFLIAFLAMLVIPICYAFYLSLFKNTLIGGKTFAGLANYLQAFTDSQLYAGLGRVGLFLGIQVPVMLIVALFLALALDAAAFRGMRFVRLAIFVPYAIPGVVGVLIWGYLYGIHFGLITQILEGMGIPAPNLLSSQNVLGAMMNIVTWQYAGYNMIILYAALRAVPGELFESAVLDGAGVWRIAWSIKIPAVRSAILLCFIFSGIGAFQVFTEPNLLQPLAPTVVSQSYTPSFYAYNVAFVNHDTGYAAALAFTLGLVIAIVSYVVQLGIQRRALR